MPLVFIFLYADDSKLYKIGWWYLSGHWINSQFAILLAAGNITEMAVDDIPTVTGATAMTLFVRQPKNWQRQPANAQIKLFGHHWPVTGIEASTLFINFIWQSPLISRHWMWTNEGENVKYRLYKVRQKKFTDNYNTWNKLQITYMEMDQNKTKFGFQSIKMHNSFK